MAGFLSGNENIDVTRSMANKYRTKYRTNKRPVGRSISRINATFVTNASTNYPAKLKPRA